MSTTTALTPEQLDALQRQDGWKAFKQWLTGQVGGGCVALIRTSTDPQALLKESGRLDALVRVQAWEQSFTPTTR